METLEASPASSSATAPESEVAPLHPLPNDVLMALKKLQDELVRIRAYEPQPYERRPSPSVDPRAVEPILGLEKFAFNSADLQRLSSTPEQVEELRILLKLEQPNLEIEQTAA